MPGKPCSRRTKVISPETEVINISQGQTIPELVIQCFDEWGHKTSPAQSAIWKMTILGESIENIQETNVAGDGTATFRNIVLGVSYLIYVTVREKFIILFFLINVFHILFLHSLIETQRYTINWQTL